jgi:uncharacterized protein YhbP (UPF0306 family)
LALDYLAGHRVLTLATAAADDLWAASVFYVNQGFALMFLSAGHTRHARNLEANPYVAATIQEDYADWLEIKGIQLEGRVELLQGQKREVAIALYEDKYPFIQGAGSQIEMALSGVNWYALVPQRLYFIDNSKGLGHRDQILPVP